MPELSTSGGDARGLVFDIQRFSVHDGPGIRTTVFLKGCHLRCEWCANPESQASRPELLFWRDRCDCCGICLDGVCPTSALSMASPAEEKIHVDRTGCTLCGACAERCPPGALQMSGRWMLASEALAEVLRDVTFYRRSGGGMTLSGGEPLLQIDFALALLRGARERGIGTAVETCGSVPWRSLDLVLPWMDLVLFDVKHAANEVHRRLTGTGNQPIIRNLRRLVGTGVPTIVRLPIIPGINDSRWDIEALGELIGSLEPRPPVELMPYHRLGVAKYRALGQEYRLEDVAPSGGAHLEDLRAALAAAGIRVLE